MRKKHSWFKSIDNRRKGKKRQIDNRRKGEKRQIDNRRKGKKRQEEKKYLRINVKYFSIAWIIFWVITIIGIHVYLDDMISSNPYINPTQNIFILNFVDLRSFVYISGSMVFGSWFYGLFNVESKDTLKEQIKLILLLLTIVFLPILYKIHKEKQNFLLLNEEGITYHVEDGLFCAGKHVEIAWDSIYSVGYFIKFPNSKQKEYFIRVDYSNRIPQKTEYLEVGSINS